MCSANAYLRNAYGAAGVAASAALTSRQFGGSDFRFVNELVLYSNMQIRAWGTGAGPRIVRRGQRGRNEMAKKVMIVEDNELNMKLFNDLLEAHGYATLKTADGIEAIELARAHHPDLILMDIQLPEVSGLEVTKWIKEDETLKSIPVIAVTAFAMKGDEERIRDGGCEAYLSKPISVAKFLETVRAYAGAA